MLATLILITAMPITSFANSIDNPDEILKSNIEELKSGFDKKDSYDYITSMALRHSGYDQLKIQKRMNIYSPNNNHNNSRNIMNIVSGGLNPRDYKGKNYVEDLKNSIDKTDRADYLAKSIIALEMSEEEYDFSNILNKIKEKLIITEDMAYVELYDNPDLESTAWVTIALSYNKDNDEVLDLINKTKKFYKRQQDELALIGSSKDTALIVQAIISLGENPLSGEWMFVDEDGKGTTMLDGIMSCKVDGSGFSYNPGVKTVGIDSNQHMLAAFADMHIGESMFKNIKHMELGEAKAIKIDLGKNAMFVGEAIELKASVFDQNNSIIKNVDLVWTTEDESIVKIHGNKLTALKPGKTFIKVSLKDKEDIFVKEEIEVKKLEDLRPRVESSLQKLLGFYEEHKSIDYMSGLAARHIEDGFNVEKLNAKDNLRLYSMDHAIHYAKNIMEIVSANMDPRDYTVMNKDKEIKNKDFVKLLEDSQNSKGNFIVSQDQKASIVSQSLSIMALDMVDGNYKKEQAINSLIEMLEDKEYEIDGLYDEVGTKALAATALSKHKTDHRIKTVVDSQIEYLKEKQNKYGGYDYRGYENNSFAIGTVIQCLIANDINPETWIKDNNMVSILLDNQMEDGMFKFSSDFEIDKEGISDFKATETAFAALSDVYNQKSMYNSIKYKEKVEPEKPIEDFEIQYIDKGHIVNGRQIDVKIKVKNLKEYNNKTKIIVGLYDKSADKLENYSIIQGQFKPREEKELEVNFLVPLEGEYYIKPFILGDI